MHRIYIDKGKIKPKTFPSASHLPPTEGFFTPQILACTPKTDEVPYMLLYTENSTKIKNKTKCTPNFKMQWEPCSLIFVEPACFKMRQCCYYFAKVNVRGCVCASIFVWAITSSFINWVSKLFDTAVVFEEEKCHLEHFILGRLKAKITLEVHIN